MAVPSATNGFSLPYGLQQASQVTWNALLSLQSQGLRDVATQPYGMGVMFSARYGFGLVSGGEDVAVTLLPNAAGGTNVTVFSKSRIRTTLVDWGKNRDNVIVVSDAIMRAGGYAPQPPAWR